MEPLLTAAGTNVAAAAATSLLKVLAERPYNQRLVRAIAAQWGSERPRPSMLEKRRLGQLFTVESIWELLIEASVTVSPQLPNEIEKILSTRRSAAVRKRMAEKMAKLAVDELPGVLPTGEAFKTITFQLRTVADDTRATLEATHEIIQQLDAIQGRTSVSNAASADVSEYRRYLKQALSLRRPSAQFALTVREAKA